MGSEQIWNLSDYDGFAFVGVVGEKNFNEKRSTERCEEVQVTQIFSSEQNSDNENGNEIESWSE